VQSQHHKRRLMLLRQKQLAIIFFGLFFINNFIFAFDETFHGVRIDDKPIRYRLTSSTNGLIFAQWVILLHSYGNTTQQPVAQPANISIVTSFCSACGPFNFGYMKNIPVNFETQQFNKVVSFDNTGTIINPLQFEMSFFYEHPENDTYYLAFATLSRSYSSCSFDLSVVNKSVANSFPQAPIPGQNGSIDVTRQGRNIVVNYALARDPSYPQDVLQYRPYIFYFRESSFYDRSFCDIFTSTDVDWQNDTNSFVISAKLISSDVILTVRVRNPRTGLVADYRRTYVPYSEPYNLIRLLGSILIGLMIALPIVILYSGYHRSFALRFLVFQYLSQSEEGNSLNEPELNDRMLRKASQHTFVLIVSQIACQLVLIAVALAWNSYLTLNFIIAIFTLPLLLFGMTVTFSRRAPYILGYIVGALWFFALQCTVMLFTVHVGSDAIYKSYQIDAEAPLLISQIIITVNAVLVIISLSPTSFLFHKLNSAVPESYSEKITKKQRTVVLLCIANILISILWLNLILYFIPSSAWKFVTSEVISLFTSVHLNLAFSLLTLFAAFACLYNSETFNKINIFILVFGILYTLLSTLVDMLFFSDTTDMKILFISVTILRLTCVGLQMAIFVISVNLYIERRGERLLRLVSKFCSPQHHAKTRGVLAALSFITTLWKSILELLFIVFHFEVTFPPLYLMAYLFLLGNPMTFVASYFDAPLLYIISFIMYTMPWVTLLFLLTLTTWNPPIFIVISIYLLLIAITGIRQCLRRSVKEPEQFELAESQSQETTNPKENEIMSRTKDGDDNASGIKLDEEEDEPE